MFVVIVSARLSGLRTAFKLNNAGVSYVTLEAMNHVGRHTLSTSLILLTEDSIVKLGAAWIDNSNRLEMYTLSQEFRIKLVKQRAKGVSLYQYIEGNVQSHSYE